MRKLDHFINGADAVSIGEARIIPATLELGGKSPNIIFEDADLAQAVPAALRAFTMNAGQICTAGTRILVQRSIHDQFVAALVVAAKAMKVGASADAAYGPSTTEAQYAKVFDYFEVAKADGAHLAIGGPEGLDKDAAGRFLNPTVYTEVSPNLRIAQEEVFGPSPRSSRSRTRPKRCASPTTPNTAWPPESGPAIWAGPCAWPRGSRPARSMSTNTGQAVSRRRSGATSRAATGSRRGWRRCTPIPRSSPSPSACDRLLEKPQWPKI